jgi:hypothetical protein
MIANNIRYVQKVYHEFFITIFDRVVYLIEKFMINIRICIKTNDKKSIK